MRRRGLGYPAEQVADRSAVALQHSIIAARQSPPQQALQAPPPWIPRLFHLGEGSLGVALRSAIVSAEALAKTRNGREQSGRSVLCPPPERDADSSEPARQSCGRPGAPGYPLPADADQRSTRNPLIIQRYSSGTKSALYAMVFAEQLRYSSMPYSIEPVCAYPHNPQLIHRAMQESEPKLPEGIRALR